MRMTFRLFKIDPQANLQRGSGFVCDHFASLIKNLWIGVLIQFKLSCHLTELSKNIEIAFSAVMWLYSQECYAATGLLRGLILATVNILLSLISNNKDNTNNNNNDNNNNDDDNNH